MFRCCMALGLLHVCPEHTPAVGITRDSKEKKTNKLGLAVRFPSQDVY